MALIQCDYYSEALGLSTSMNVILPQKVTGKCRTLYLLHGLSDDHTIWSRRTSIERYAAAYDIAVVMPAAHRSFYTNMVYGGAYWTWISEELPRIAQSYFPLSASQADNFVAGVSMGGYGALKLALRRPEQFAAAAGLSGALDVANSNKRLPRDYKLIFGSIEQSPSAEDDLFHLLEKAKQEGTKLPRLYQYCGTEDYLYNDNIKFRDTARRLGIPLDYKEGPGDHDWRYWDEMIKDVLHWMFSSEQ